MEENKIEIEEEIILLPEDSDKNESRKLEHDLEEIDPILTLNEPEIVEKPIAIGEVIELRNENYKVFRMSDGTEQARFYTEPVHVFDETENCFVEIDNTLIKDDAQRHYSNKKGKFSARFSCDDTNDEFFTVEKGVYKITVSAKKNSRKSNIGIIPSIIRSDETEKNGSSKTHETIIYENVVANTNYEYKVLSNRVKENIIINQKADVYNYSFYIDMVNLKADLLENEKKIVFSSTETNEQIFTIPAPFMTDAKGIYSENVYYDINKVNDNRISLIVKADSIWLNSEERAFPVILDPQIVLEGSSQITTYSWINGIMQSGSTHAIGTSEYDEGLCTVSRMYMALNMPTLPRNPRIKKAEISIYQYAGSSYCNEFPKIGLYHVTQSITTGNYTPTNEALMLDYERMKVSNEIIKYTFDITSLIDSIKNNEASYSNLVFKMLDENAPCPNFVLWYGSTSATNSPEFAITYETSYGINTQGQTHTHELGRLGTGSIDLQRGNLMLDSTDFAWSGNRMPVTIKHLYNSALSSYNYTANSSILLNTAEFSNMKVGRGWKLNYMQSMVTKVFTLEGVNYAGYVYIGENGDETYFKEGITEKCYTENDIQCCYKLFENMDGTGDIYDPYLRKLTIGNQVYLFDTMGRLISISDEHNNSITILYNAYNEIQSITDGAGREFVFNYSAGNLLTSITPPDYEYNKNTSVCYTYTADCLTGISYPGGKNVSIAYNGSSYKPSEVILKEGTTNIYKTTYTYNGDRVSQVKEYGVDAGAFVEGSSSSYSYSISAKRTIVSSVEKIGETLGDNSTNTIQTVYTFDDDGNTISSYVYTLDTGNDQGGESGSGINPYSGDGGANVVSNINNLLLNHSFANLDNWTSMSTNPSDFSIKSYKNEYTSAYGENYLYMYSNQTTGLANGVYQTTDILPAGDYTFSAYARTPYGITGDSNPGVYIRVTNSDGTLIITESEHIKSKDTEFTRLIVPFKIQSAMSVKVCILIDGKGTIYADAAQLENNTYANSYNMLVNGNFEKPLSTGWTNGSSSGISISDTVKFNMSKSLCLIGNVDQYRTVYQNVAIKKYRGTKEVFTLSGWAKANGLVNRDRDNVTTAPAFCIRAVIKYYDTYTKIYNTETHYAKFSPCTEEWQLASVQFSKEKYSQIEYIRVYCDYSYNIGTAYFDDIQLVRNSLQTGLSSSDFTTSSTAVGADDEEQKTTTDTTPTFAEKVDDFGNNITETTFTNGEFGTIYRSFAYNDDDSCCPGNDVGNNLVRETDARGNETFYSVDTETSRNELVEDRCGNKTAYEYDTAGRTTKITAKNVNDTPISNVSYAYDTFDNLTEITRGDTMKYSLVYNDFHNLQSIGVDGKQNPLVTYAYKNGNGRLKSVTYANGNVMKATYNSVGQMTCESWFENASATDPIAKYRYVYDGGGNIVKSIDILRETEYNYAYEEGKIVRATECSVTLDETTELVTAKTLINTILYVYNTDGQLTKKRIIPADGEEFVYYYENSEKEGTTLKFTAGGKTITSHSKTDSFGRKVFDELQLGTGFVSRQFSYCAGAVTDEHSDNGKLKSSATTNLVSQIMLSGGRTLAYTYDPEERITSVTDTQGTITNTTTYTYDALGQLTSETVNAVKTKFVYDKYGNISEKGVCDSSGNIIQQTKISYAYNDNYWRDLLSSYNGQSITYDPQGNPTSYLGNTLTWEKGRQLKTFGSNSYKYNANGIRTSKTIGGVTHTYTLDGTKILKESWGTNSIIPLYDNEDSVCGLTYNNTPYYFYKNLQGDIISITNANGAVIANYKYDAWGVCTITSDTSGVNIATINPFHYRGYYYDTETGLYYLQSRYYNPTVGRFINGDEVVILFDAYSVLSYNLFAYCENDCIDRHDTSGNKFLDFIKAVFTTITRTVTHIITVNPISVNITQKGKFQSLFNLASFYRDRDGVYHTSPNCWQQYFGYNDLYDMAFYLGTSMKKGKYEFSYKQHDWILWAWKGDYLNLGAGAELGIYKRLTIGKYKTKHWNAAKDRAMKMELMLKYNGKTIISYKPKEKQWWITGFNPYYLNRNANQLKATYKVYFHDEDMFQKFKERNYSRDGVTCRNNVVTIDL